MSEPSVVRSMREDAKPARPGSAIDLMLGGVALAAVAALAYFGVAGVEPGASICA